MSLATLTGAKNVTTVNRTDVMNSWFSPPCAIRIPIPGTATSAGQRKPGSDEPVQTECADNELYKIVAALRDLTKSAAAAVPPLPPGSASGSACATAGTSAYSRIDFILSKDSHSSRLLAQKGLLVSFRQAAVMELSLTPLDFSAHRCNLKGYRRSLVSRPDGHISERIIDPQGNELMRFSYESPFVTTLPPFQRPS